MIKAYLQSFNLLTEEEIDELYSKAELRTMKKGDFLITEGKICKEIGFVQSGLFRVFYHNTTGEDITYCFRFANSFVGAYSSFITQSPTIENIQAITDCEILVIPAQELIRLEQSSINWTMFSKVIAQQEFVSLEQRFLLFLRESAEVRYKDLLENYPEYLQFIPLNYLASYLGITQRHLSRIRKSMMI